MGICTIAHSTSRGSRIARCSRTGNAEPHAEYDDRHNTHAPPLQRTMAGIIARTLHIHVASTVALSLTTSETCEISGRQEQASSKRLFLICRPSASRTTRAWGVPSASEQLQRYGLISDMTTFNAKKFKQPTMECRYMA